jgi:hypothetical protein
MLTEPYHKPDTRTTYTLSYPISLRPFKQFFIYFKISQVDSSVQGIIRISYLTMRTERPSHPLRVDRPRSTVHVRTSWLRLVACIRELSGLNPARDTDCPR